MNWNDPYLAGGFFAVTNLTESANVSEPIPSEDGDYSVGYDESSDGSGHAEFNFALTGSGGIVNALVPTSGAAGQRVALTGTQLDTTGLTTVYFGTTLSPSVTCPSPTSCSAVVPPGSGVVNVTASVRGYIAAAGTYSYLPSVTSLSEVAGHTGDSVTVTGLGFNAGYGLTAFTVAGVTVPPANVHCASSTTCTIVIPPGNGVGYIVATVNGTASDAAPDNRFSYGAAIISAISPNVGQSSGGDTVVLTGNGFSPSMIVYFGSAATAPLSCFDNTECTVITPANNPGTVDITVAVGGVTSATSAADRFTYVYEPAISSLTLDQSQVWSSTVVDLTIAIDATAPAGGTLVQLTAYDPTAHGLATGVTIPANVTVPAGASSVTFAMEVSASPLTSGVTVTASTGNAESAVTFLPHVGQVFLSIDQATATLDVRSAAPAAGDVIDISADTPSAVTLPATVTIPSGATTATFEIFSATTKATLVDVTATFDGTSSSAGIEVGDPIIIKPTPPTCSRKPCPVQ